MAALFRYSQASPWEPFDAARSQVLETSGVSRWTFSRAVERLQAAGVLAREYTPGPADRRDRKPSRWRFLAPPPVVYLGPEVPTEQEAHEMRKAAAAIEQREREKSARAARLADLAAGRTAEPTEEQNAPLCVPVLPVLWTGAEPGISVPSILAETHPAAELIPSAQTVGAVAPERDGGSMPLPPQQTLSALPSDAEAASRADRSRAPDGGLRPPPPLPGNNPHLGSEEPERPWRERTRERQRGDRIRASLAVVRDWREKHAPSKPEDSPDAAHGRSCVCAKCLARHLR